MKAQFCYRCGREFREGESYHLLYIEQTERLVLTCDLIHGLVHFVLDIASFNRLDGLSTEFHEYRRKILLCPAIVLV